MRLKKKMLGIILSLVLALGLMPGMSMTAYADGTVTEVSTADEFKIAVANGGEVKLTDNFELPLDKSIDFKKEMTIDLNGHTITVEKNGMYCYWAICAPVAIRDGADGGKIINPSTSYAFITRDDASLTLEGGTLEFTGSRNSGIDVFMAPFTMTGGTIRSNGTSIWRDGAKVTIRGGTIIGDFRDSSGEIDITGGSFSFDPSALLKEGDTALKVGDYWVVNATAESSDSGSGSSSGDSSDNTNTNTDTSAKVPYDDVPISTGSVKDITGTAAATAESNPFGTKIENNSNLNTLLSLTDAEVAQGVNVWLDVQDMSASVPQTDKNLIKDKSGDYTVGLYLDINLFKKVGGNDATKVTETNGKVKASIAIPESLRKSGRTFELIRVHDGVATAIAGTYDENTHVFTFETDKFSTYALAYKDSAVAGSTTNSTLPTSPKTGDSNDARVWYLLLIASFGGLGFVELSKKKED